MGLKMKNHSALELMKRFSDGSKRFFVFALLASVLNTVFNSLTPQVIKITVDSVIGEEAFSLPGFILSALDRLGGREYLRSHLILIALVIILIAVFAAVCNYLCRVLISKASEGFVKRMRDTLFSHVQKLPFSWHVRHQTGDIIQRCTSDVEVIRNFVASQLLEVFRTTFLVIFAMSIMFSMNAKLSWIALAFVPVIMGYSGFFYNKIARRFLVADEAEGELSSTVQENLTGVRVVRAFGREKYEIDRFDKKNNRFAQLWIKLGHIMSVYWGVGDLITGLQTVTIIVAGTIETVNGNLTLGGFLAFVSYNATLIWPIRGLGRVLSEMSKATVSFERVNYILDQDEEQDCENPVTPPMDRDIHFERINFHYGNQKPVLKNIDFTIKAGTTFGILGGTGSGKSTLMHLLNRLYDLPKECGRITIGGVDISSMKRDWVRSNIGIVLQEPFLFSRSIEENIRVARPGAGFEEVRYAASIACVDDAISEFTNGYDTIVGERGVTLSGGQKQRVAIARMLMQKTPIMVFDDSLSAVDSETDSKIREALNTKLGSATVILISHRITTLMKADQILVLEDGQIKEQGTHQELLEQNGIYKSVYDIQMSSDDRKMTEESHSREGE
jgi:ATP-binding cassette subfamily B protein